MANPHGIVKSFFARDGPGSFPYLPLCGLRKGFAMSKIYRYQTLHLRMQVASSPRISPHHSLRPSKQWLLRIYSKKCTCDKFSALPPSSILNGENFRSCFLASCASIDTRRHQSVFARLNRHRPKLCSEHLLPLQFESKPSLLSTLAENKFISINISDARPTLISGCTNVEVKKC